MFHVLFDDAVAQCAGTAGPKWRNAARRCRTYITPPRVQRFFGNRGGFIGYTWGIPDWLQFTHTTPFLFLFNREVHPHHLVQKNLHIVPGSLARDTILPGQDPGEFVFRAR